MHEYWAVAHQQDEVDDPHYSGPFETEQAAREGRDHLTLEHHHLEGGIGWAFYVVKRPRDWRP